MKKQDIFFGISDRSIAAQPLEPISLRMSLVQHGLPAFNLILDKLREEFSFLWNGKDEIADYELVQFDRLFVWFVKQVEEFPVDSARPESALAKLLAFAAILDCDDRLWDEVYKIAPTISEQLMMGLANLLKERHANSEDILANWHLSASHIQVVLADITSKKWKTLGWLVDQLCMSYRSPIKLQAVAALSLFNHSVLQPILDDEQDFFEIVSYTHHLPTDQSLQFALGTKNWTFKFWAFHHSVRHAERAENTYAPEWEMLLVEASKDTAEWSRWMAFFNEYPSRYPHIQHAIGNVLAQASGAALRTFINSISENALNADGQSIVTTLTAFRQKATPRERKQLWRAAFKRWQQWDFGCTKQTPSLFNVVSSLLDFPVIGYLTECLDAEGRDEMFAEIEMRAASISRVWHSDVTAAMTERFKLISTHRLLAHADAVSAGNVDWLPGSSLVKPPWEDGSLYRHIRYNGDVS